MTTEPEVHWSQDQMVEVLLSEPDDFLKVRETLTRIGVASRKDKTLYQWQQSDTPKIYVSGVSAPSYIEPIFENKQNGALSWLEFLVTTTGGVSDNDKILVKLPYGW